ncbi:MAG: membrane protein insertase YidC, partial [Woeseiaceae bacterium]|nr:membrane protein insertase YidC [Woeseiaceae bacterium]
MDNQRLLVWATFLLLAWLTYQTWLADQAPPADGNGTPAAAEGSAESESLDSLPELPEATSEAAATEQQAPTLDPAPAAADDASVVTVTTDVLDVEISTTGATLQRAVLLDYPVAKDDPDNLVELLNPAGPDRGSIQTGLI